MATKTIFVLDPTAKANVQRYEKAARLEALEGKRIGFLDNGKPNADIFLARIEELLSERYGFSGVIRRSKVGGVSKDSSAAPAPEEIIAEFADKCDLVVNAIGD